VKEALVVLAAALALPACASMAAPPAEDDGGPGAVEVGHAVVMYLPNRVVDLFDVLRFGVNLGPGVGIQAKATDPVQVTWMTRASVGVGFQSFRHVPGYAATETAAALGPAGAEAGLGLGWHQSPTDLRLEVHPAIAGAHVAVDPVEILDFVLGFFTVDIREDDL
jgi:hypothetical protein